MSKKIRVRFAPSPTGYMHLGNVRAALMNYLFARQQDGTFVLRIEDTDDARNIDEAALSIYSTLKWLSLSYDEGPNIGGNYGPYLQSERKEKHKKYLDDLIQNQKVYRCFCAKEVLESNRKKQIESGQPPRYDGTCRNLSEAEIKIKLENNNPFIWRFKLNKDEVIEIETLERGVIKFEMKNFSDFPLTRNDGTFTFLFSNFVDDSSMAITHVIRGEDHLSNTAMQAALFNAFAISLPSFLHLPILCSLDGKKMSKRDFGFGICELKEEGYLPSAILNYLALLGTSFKEEVQSLSELVQNYDFKNISSTGSIKFDLEKLKWLNHKWIERTPSNKLVDLVKPFLHDQIQESISLKDDILEFILEKVKTDLKTLKDIGSVISFYFNKPAISRNELENKIGTDKVPVALNIINKHIELCSKTEQFLDAVKKEAKDSGLKIRDIFSTLRYLLTGDFNGIGMHDLFGMLPNDVILERLKVFG